MSDVPVALVTGAGRGLGRAVALALAGDGMAVAVNDRDGAAAHDTVEAVQAAGGQASPYVASVDDEATVDAVLTAIAGEHGRLDALVSNAGIGSSGRRLSDTEPAEVERLFRTHALGSHIVARAALPLLRAAGDGRIVVVSSVTTDVWPSHGGPYSMAKAALEALARTLAAEERRHGVRVNIVAAGFFDTRMGREVRDRYAQSKSRAAAVQLGDPADLAEVVRRLVAPGALDVTGQRLVVGA